MRRYFADLLAILSNRYQLCPTARHLAVYLLDLFMDHYDVAVKQLYVTALTCLLLASKSTVRLHLCLWVFYLGSSGVFGPICLVRCKCECLKCCKFSTHCYVLVLYIKGVFAQMTEAFFLLVVFQAGDVCSHRTKRLCTSSDRTTALLFTCILSPVLVIL